MKFYCDTEKMKQVSKDMDIEINYLSNTIKKFYDLINNYSNVWQGPSATNYRKYLESKKADYENIIKSLSVFNLILSENTNDLENTISKAKVS